MESIRILQDEPERVAAVAAEGDLPAPGEPSQAEDEEPPVSLGHRALPLIELLKAAAKAERNVMWDSN